MKSNTDLDEFIGRCCAVRKVRIKGPPVLTPRQKRTLPLLRKERYKSDVLSKYKCAARTRGLEFALEHDDFMRLIDEPCHYYCWAARGGIDRVDNSVGYLPDNAVPCCTPCNRMKSTSSKEAFIAQCVRIADHHSPRGQ